MLHCVRKIKASRQDEDGNWDSHEVEFGFAFLDTSTPTTVEEMKRLVINTKTGETVADRCADDDGLVSITKLQRFVTNMAQKMLNMEAK